MSETKEYKKIKKIYGENFAKVCRELFPTILEEEGKLLEILEKKFANNGRTLGDDITSARAKEELKELIFSEYDEKNEEEKYEEIETRTPYEILDKAGYDLYECKTEEELEKFRKYYTIKEHLCTFDDKKTRLNDCVCFFAVSKDVDEIKRKNFVRPKKEDIYSTSVLAIQFSKSKPYRVQIISRYNHSVDNPNCTLNNNLNRLAPGLEQSFANLLKERGMGLTSLGKLNPQFSGYVLANDDKYYKYNMEVEGNYYCPGNVVLFRDGKILKIDNPADKLLADYFYISQKDKTIEKIDPRIKDSFLDDFKNEDGSSNIRLINVITNKKEIEKTLMYGETDVANVNKIVKVFKQDVEEPVIIGIDKNNNITAYRNNELEQVKDNFLKFNQELTYLDTPNLKETGSHFLYRNELLEYMNIPEIEKVGFGFLSSNQKLKELELPKLKLVGDDFLKFNQELTYLDTPNLKETGSHFLYRNELLEYMNISEIEKVGFGFLSNNQKLKELELPKLKLVGDDFMGDNKTLEKVTLPKLQQAGDDFLCTNRVLNDLTVPELEKVGYGFLYSNEGLTDLKLPNLRKAETDFMTSNQNPIQLKWKKFPKITSKVFALTDKITGLTTTQVNTAEKNIKELKEKDKEENERNT